MAAPTLTILDQGSTTTDGNTFTTASVTTTAGATLALLVAGGHGGGSGSNVVPSSITGLGTWTQQATDISEYIRGTLYTATADGGTGTVTITYPSNSQATHWHLIQLDGATSLGTPATINSQDGAPSWSLGSVGSDSGVLLLAIVNSDTASLDPGSGYSAQGDIERTAATNMSSTAMWADPAVPNAGFSSSATGSRKVGIAIEVVGQETARAWTKYQGNRVPLIARSHTRIEHAPGEQWTLIYDTDFSTVSDWDVKTDQTQSNDNSINIAANAVPSSTGLTIYGKRESGYSRPYTSAELYGTGPQVVPNYFRAEVVGSIMDESGLWPCLLWFRPQSGGDGSNGEIDVMEYMGGRVENLDRKRIAVTMHNEYGATQDSAKNPIFFDQLTNPTTTAEHTYTIEKVPGEIRVWIDDDTHQTRYFRTGDKPWWDRIMEATDRTWYPRITLQIGAGSGNAVVPEPDSGWTESTMHVKSLRLWELVQ